MEKEILLIILGCLIGVLYERWKYYRKTGEHLQDVNIETKHKTKTERDELFGLIESIHHLFESDKPITKDSHIGRSIELAYKTFKTN